ncbi:MAG: hypothetical protein GY795_35015 [Desulfobacterales bacterium]|nr:hypothetical protein [Desulfobacterales bacterium]
MEKSPALPVVKDLLEKIVPAVYNSLYSLKIFESKQKSLRMILAGRYLATMEVIRNASIELVPYPLSPFDYKIIWDSVSKYLNHESDSNTIQISAHLLYLTGGHPGCMAEVLQKYRDQGTPPDVFFKYLGKSTSERIVREISEDIRSGLLEYDKKLAEIINYLTVFRYLDSTVLKHIIDANNLSWISNGYDLSLKLTATYLFKREKYLVRDDIIRRLLVIQLRDSDPGQFSQNCQEAREIFANLIQNLTMRNRERWTIEYLFQSLQKDAAIIQYPEKREKLRETFLNKNVSEALQFFTDRDDILVERFREERDTLIGMMDEDWEFCFTVNYYLREDEYNEQPYIELKNKISQFFDQMLKKDKLEQHDTDVASAAATSNQYEKLFTWLNRLVDAEFQMMIHSLLSVEQQNVLTPPVNRVNFLGDMQKWNLLDQAEQYLYHKYPERFPC